MKRLWLISTLLGIHVGACASAQVTADTETHPCSLEPMFHCAEMLDDGSAIGHFGYKLICPEGLEQITDLFIQIGDENHFVPSPKDRGQPKMFTPGEHFDEFETGFTPQEVKESKEIYWSVKKIRARVDFSREADGILDCTKLAY